MKAAVLHQLGTVPKYEDFPEPMSASDEQLLVTVKAAAIKQLDKAKASGKHYTNYPQLPTVVGVDGVGVLGDGTRIYAKGLTGMMAEKALVNKNEYTILPENIDDATAAALPNALMGAAMALLYRAKIKKGNTVLINGATGITGKIAVQTAKYYGAAKIIATGRNSESLQSSKELGADEIVPLKQEDEEIIKKLKEIESVSPIDIVIDYLWGHPIELILAVLMRSPSHKVKVVTVGEMAGATISLPSGILRSADIQLLGSGIGSLSQADIDDYASVVLPEMFKLAADGKLKIEVEPVALKEVEAAWVKNSDQGRRLVLMM